MPQNNVVTMTTVRSRRAARTRYASAADTFSIDQLLADLDDGAISGSGDYDLTVDVHVNARGRQAA